MIPRWITDKVDTAIKLNEFNYDRVFFAYICLGFFGTLIYCARLLAGKIPNKEIDQCHATTEQQKKN